MQGGSDDPLKRRSPFLIHYPPESFTHRNQNIKDQEGLRSKPAQHLFGKLMDVVAASDCRMALDVEKIKKKEITCDPKLCFPKDEWDHNFIALEQSDPLSHLQGDLRNLLDYPQKIVYISPTALLNNPVKSGTSEIMPTLKEMTSHFKSCRHFGSLSLSSEEYAQLKHLNIKGFSSRAHELEFDDNFECANLYLASKHTDGSYLLINRFDYNTRSYGQWFYFRVNNRRGLRRRFTFRIINMTKGDSMFGKGLKVSVCRNGMWSKEGEHIQYYRNSLLRQSEQKYEAKKYYRTLQFSIELAEGEEVHLAYNQPYSYTRLGSLLDKISEAYETNKEKSILFRRSEVASTRLGNTIDMLTFTARDQEPKNKQVVFIIGRAHPAETAGSFVIEGILKTLIELMKDKATSNSASQLLNEYVIKIVPMINPDGVILGNSRCNLLGFDLNRSWKKPKIEETRQVHFLKKEILGLGKKIEMFIDLHAHSKKTNVFAYGNHDMHNPYATRQFPFLLSKVSPHDFLFEECRFSGVGSKLNTQKEGTARVFLGNALKIPNIFTIENSYCSAMESSFHYDSLAYESIGNDILKAISIYYSHQFANHAKKKIENDKGQCNLEMEGRECVSSLTQVSGFQELKDEVMRELKKNIENVEMGLESDFSESDSENEERLAFEIVEKTRKISKIQHTFKRDKMLAFLSRNNMNMPLKKTNIGTDLKGNNYREYTEASKKQEPPLNPEKRILTIKPILEELSRVELGVTNGYFKGHKKCKSNFILTKRQRNTQAIRTERMNCLPVVQIGLQDELSASRKLRLSKNQWSSPTLQSNSESIVNQMRIANQEPNKTITPKSYQHLLKRTIFPIKKNAEKAFTTIDTCKKEKPPHLKKMENDERVKQYLRKISNLQQRCNQTQNKQFQQRINLYDLSSLLLPRDQ